MRAVLIWLMGFVAVAMAQSGCVSPNITLEEKLRLNGEANDHDNNNRVTTSDLEYDLGNNYDTNDDGVTTEEEWITRWTCAFGDSAYFARYVFNILSAGEAEIVTNSFNRPPFTNNGLPLDQFLETNRQRYVSFEANSCVNTDLTLNQKLDLNAQQNDHDNNGIVTSSDIAYDLNEHFDANNDGRVTKDEWVLHWCCVYGDTAAYARFVWEELSQGADYIDASMFLGPPFDTGVPIGEFRSTNRQRYLTYEQQVPVGK